MTINQKISARILLLIAEGVEPMDAFRQVCGAEKVDAMISELYYQLRGEKPA